MNITLTKSISNKKALQLVLSVFALLLGAANLPAFAQPVTTSSLVTNAGGTIDDVNPGCAVNIRINYGKRFPFMQKAWDCDELELIRNGQSNGDTGNGEGGNGRRDQTTNATTSGSNTGSTAGGNQSNIKKSKLATSGKTFTAFDIMVKPFGQPGHYLPGADPKHQPQYATQGDAYVQYAQTKMIATDKPKTMRDMELFENQLETFALPISDTQFQMIDRENKQRYLELMFDPERFMWAATTQGQLQSASGANVLAGSAEAAWKQATERIVQADGNGGNGAGGGAGGAGGAQVGALINIANEQSGVPTAADNPYKTVPQAVWMVQQMYKFVFVPLAILFLLPGAVMTQVKGQIVQGFKLNAEDQSSPFEGILRAVIAVFLIPATQLIVSYSIDVGNSMAYSVKDWVDLQLIFDWSRELTYNVPIDNVDNAILPPNGGQQGGQPGGGQQGGGGGFLGGISSFLGGIPFIGGALQSGFNSLAGFLGLGEGLGADVPEQKTVNERQLWLSSAMELAFNMATYIFSSAVIVLGAYQLVFMCYLFLLGPLAAAFFAWPKIQAPNSSQNLFRDVFSNWVNAVIVVALWRFYWMVILAIMTQRILYIQDSGGASNLQWEVAVFTCLLGLMMWVPFNPWSFDPSQAFAAASSAGQSMMQGASGAAGAAAQAGGAPASQVQAVQGQVSEALAPMSAVAKDWSTASNGPSNNYASANAGGGAGQNGYAGLAGNTGGNNSSSTTANADVSPPPNASAVASASPLNTSEPGASSRSADSSSQPPTSLASNSGTSNANLSTAAESAPAGVQVASLGDTTPLSPSSNASLAVNTNASSGQISEAMPEANATMANLGVGTEGTPPGGGTGGGNEGGGSANLLASSGPPITGGGGETSQGGGGSGTTGGGGETQVASLALASSGSSNQGDRGNNNAPPLETGQDTDDQGPPPTATA